MTAMCDICELAHDLIGASLDMHQGVRLTER
jgi:hypothetical protein